MRCRLGLTLIPALLVTLPGQAQPGAAGIEFFETEIRPLLADRCFPCHGPKKQRSKLRLDHISTILTGGERGPALVPGQPAILFAATAQVSNGDGVVFGDGLRCANQSVVRLGTLVADSAGDAEWGPGLGTVGEWGAGETRFFQAWYRDSSGGPCATGFNLSNGAAATFAP